MTIDPARALSFGRLAEEYELWRPGYPPDAVDWLVPPGATRVADVGAGTGKLTGSLLDRGLAVDALEPDPGMLAVLRRVHPDAVPHLASAEALPLPERSVDAVLVADAWHWFAHAAAVDEVRRVLRPGGWLGLVWNTPAPVEQWEFELAGIDPDGTAGSELDAPGLPSAPEATASFPWTWEITPDQWCSHLATNSGVAAMPQAERAQHLDAARAVVARVCEATGRSTAPVRHWAVCFRWRPS